MIERSSRGELARPKPSSPETKGQASLPLQGRTKVFYDDKHRPL